MKITGILVLSIIMTIFAFGGCGSSGESNDSQENTSGTDTQQRDAVISTSSSSESESEYDPVPTDINYDYLDAGIPANFPEVIPIYDSSSLTVLGGMEQDAGGTMVYSLILGSNDQISDVSNAVVGSVENIDQNLSVEGSTMIMGYMGDWNYVITVDNGEADGYTTIITYTLTERQ